MSFNFKKEIEKLQKEFKQNRNALVSNFNNIVRQINNSRLNIQSKNRLIQQYRLDIQNTLRILILNFYKQMEELKKKEQLQLSSNSQPQPQQQSQIQLQIEEVSKVVKRALLIGINYKGTRNELNGCINDINNIEKLIKTDYEFTEITKLTDDTPNKPTRNNILSELIKILNNSKSGDSVFVHFSGHGSYTYDHSGDEYDGKDELIVTIDNKAIIDDELKQIIQTNLKQNVSLFSLFDCCHSGTILDLRYQYLDSTNYEKDTINIRNLETPSKCIMISGCLDNQVSMDALISKQFQGAMTWSFIESLKDNKNKSWRLLLEEMRNRLRASTFVQIPQLSSGLKLNIDSSISF